MNAKLGQHLTLLGLCALVFYGSMLATGVLSLEVMPQFLISALIFLSSGRMIKMASRAFARQETEAPPKRKSPEVDWTRLTGMLNWTAASLIVGCMAIFLMKPIGIPLDEAIAQGLISDHFLGTTVP
jgi:hypothetical protein